MAGATMQDPNLPLSAEERRRLAEFMDGAGGPGTYWRAHGLITAAASAPAQIRTSDWLAAVMGDLAFSDEEQAGEMLGLLARLHNQLQAGLKRGEPEIVPRSEGGEVEPEVRAWCEGYLLGSQLDDLWSNEPRAVSMLFPFGVLSGAFPLQELPEALRMTGPDGAGAGAPGDPEAAAKAEPFNSAPLVNRFRQNLPKYVTEFIGFWDNWRKQRSASSIATQAKKARVKAAVSARKVRRNEPCPCGSGKKYKKCCGRIQA